MHQLICPSLGGLLLGGVTKTLGTDACYNLPMEIKPVWKNHPQSLNGFVELVPTDWLFAIRGKNVSPPADLKDGTLVSLDKLWSNIQSEGLFDPVIIRVGEKSKTFRLEAGNHRIQVFKKHGVKFAPAYVEVTEYCGPEAKSVMTDATHNFDFNDDVQIQNLHAGSMRPSAVFRSLDSVAKML